MQKDRIILIMVVLLLAANLLPAPAVAQEPVARWSFDVVTPTGAAGFSDNDSDRSEGYIVLVNGVRGNCLKLDGYTTRLTREASAVPALKDAITIECWLALQSLPWNWSAIVSQGIGPDSGKGSNPETKHPYIQTVTHTRDRIFFGVNAHGQPGFRLSLDGTMYECTSERKLPLLRWSHLAATYDPVKGMKIFINGEEVATKEITGTLTDAPVTELLIGMNINKLGPEGSERQASADIGSRMVLHGLLDELRLYDRALPEEILANHFVQELPADQQPLQWTPLPFGPANLPPEFAALHTRLQYTEEWEAKWNVGEFPDVLVHFDLLPVRFIFWRGTGYGGVWVSENGLWMADQSLERSNAGKSPMGCSEHMSDKQTRYSHVRVLEENNARIVIHWRYAISDILYDIFGIDEENPMGEWADEYYYIYPDGVVVRHQVLWTRYLSHEWQETIVINHPGTSPDDNLSLDAMTLLNMEGASKTYSWRERGPDTFPEPAHANIQLVNLRSEYRPYIIFEPHPGIRPFNPSTIRSGYAHFPWWNHWPVAQLPNDGRRAFGPDRPSHSSLSQSIEGSEVIHEMENGSYEVMTLIGMTNLPAGSLVPLARSWNRPPALTLVAEGYLDKGFLKQQRAYVLEKAEQDAGTLTFSIQASDASPLVHPVFIVENWGSEEVQFSVNGEPLSPGKYRFGYRETVLGKDLVIWTVLQREQPEVFTISSLR